jgi:hypothetical protein
VSLRVPRRPPARLHLRPWRPSRNQPVKAAGLAVAGLGLSTASGLNTWLIRKIPGAKHVTIGTERIRPWLLAAWAATYTLSLWDAWTGAARPEAERGSSNQ